MFGISTSLIQAFGTFPGITGVVARVLAAAWVYQYGEAQR